MKVGEKTCQLEMEMVHRVNDLPTQTRCKQRRKYQGFLGFVGFWNAQNIGIYGVFAANISTKRENTTYLTICGS